MEKAIEVAFCLVCHGKLESWPCARMMDQHDPDFTCLARVELGIEFVQLRREVAAGVDALDGIGRDVRI